jgi:GTP cyclohydrolase IA
MAAVDATAQGLEAAMSAPSQAFEQALLGMLDHRLRANGRTPDLGQQKAVNGTPARWWKAIEEMTEGYNVDVAQILSVTFDDVQSDQMVLLRDVPFVSLCEHHLFPFSGTATVAYLPQNDRVVGLSKLARLVEAHARRLQVQERMTYEIASDLATHVSPHTAAIVTGRHACMSCRGVRKDAEMRTSALFGAFRNDRQARDEFFRLAN